MNSELENYNQISFQSASAHFQHPNHILASLLLLGDGHLLNPQLSNQQGAPLAILEIGCGNGNFLVPLACQHPNTSFIGIDAASEPIDQALKFAAASKATNIEFRNCFPHEAPTGPFDLIILQGVYSWIAPAGQAQLLESISSRLKQGGVLYCSHNVSPGWNIRQSVWSLLQDIPNTLTPSSRIKRARTTLENLAEVLSKDRHFGSVILPELQRLQKASDGYLFHELLNAHTNGSRLSELAETFSTCNLRFCGDTNWSRNTCQRPPKALANSDTRASQLCWWDYCRGYAFRESLFIKTATSAYAPTLDLHTIKANLDQLSFCLSFAQQTQLNSEQKNPWVAEEHYSLTPLSNSIMRSKLRERLAQDYPSFVAHPELITCTEDELALVDLIFSNQLYLSREPWQPSSLDHQTLRLYPWVAFQAEKGELLTNGLNETVAIGDFERNLVRGLAQGHNSVVALANYLKAQVPADEPDLLLRDLGTLQSIVQEGLGTLQHALLLQ